MYFYSFIKHYKEEDESKDHIHLLMHPNGQVEADEILKYLEEFDPLNPTKPLRCRPPHKCNSFGDWYLYCLHDSKYLVAHGSQSRKYHYNREDFIVSDEDEFNELIHTIDYKKMYGTQVFFEAVENGDSIIEMVRKGIIPIQQYGQYRRFMTDVFEENMNQTYRGLHVGHEEKPQIEATTGELNEDDPDNDSFSPVDDLPF